MTAPADLDARPASPAAAVSGPAVVAEVFHEWGITGEWIRKSGCAGPGLSSCPYIPNATMMLRRVAKHLDVIEALEELAADAGDEVTQ